MAHCDNIVTLARATVNCRFCHVCAFFNSREEEFAVLLPFLKEGFDAGDRAVHILDKKHRAERVRLMLGGIDAVGAEKSGRLEMRTWDDAHLRGARFDQNRMIKLLRQIGSTGSNHGTRHRVATMAGGRAKASFCQPDRALVRLCRHCVARRQTAIHQPCRTEAYRSERDGTGVAPEHL